MTKLSVLLILLSCFIVSAHAQTTKTEQSIKQLHQLLKKNADEYRELHEWSVRDYSGERPSVSTKTVKIVGYLGKLYAKRAKEVKRRPSLAAEYEKRARHYFGIYKNYSPKRSVTTAEAINFSYRIKPGRVASVGYLRAPLGATVSFSGGGSYDVTSAFSGFSFGGGWRSGGPGSSWDVDGAIFVLNGKVSVSEEDYEQTDAVSKGLSFLVGKSYAMTDQFLLGAQGGFAWQDLTVAAEDGVSAKVTSSIVPLLSFHGTWQLNQTISLQPRVMYWKGLGLSVTGNYHF